MNSVDLKKIVFVVGPTASGKSKWAFERAVQKPSILINCDSVQFYRGMDIGSAKPTLIEQKIVPHFLIDIASPSEPVNAAHFRDSALALIHEWYSKAQIYVVGGSGFYFQALEHGVFDAPSTDPLIIQDLRESKKDLYQELLKFDPESAKKISPNDHYRLERALAVLIQNKRPLSILKKEFEENKKPFPYAIQKVGLTHPYLHQQIELRTIQMLKDGLINEVRALKQNGFGSTRALQTVGYKECQLFLDGQITEQELSPLIALRTRQLAKRQMTWFKRDSDISWTSVLSEH